VTSLTATADRAWEFIAAHVREHKTFPDPKDIALNVGRVRRPWSSDIMQNLLSNGLVRCSRIDKRAPGSSLYYGWDLTDYGRVMVHNPEGLKALMAGMALNGEGDAERAAPLASPAEQTKAKPKARKPRRTGAPKRVPHKPTAAHRKPSRQQRRESDRRREHEDRATL
jgi:hypothetical protein